MLPHTCQGSRKPADEDCANMPDMELPGVPALAGGTDMELPGVPALADWTDMELPGVPALAGLDAGRGSDIRKRKPAPAEAGTPERRYSGFKFQNS